MARYEVWGMAQELSPEMCQDITDECLRFPSEEAKVSNSSNNVTGKVRDSHVRWVDSPRVMSLLDHYTRMANRESFGVDVDRIYSAQFTEYHGDRRHYFDWHGDTMWTNNPHALDRKLTTIVQLTPRSNYEGGELQIANLNLDTGLHEQGSIIVFLSFMSHRVTPVTEGCRNSLVSWMEGPVWR